MGPCIARSVKQPSGGGSRSAIIVAAFAPFIAKTMRLTERQIQAISQHVRQVAGERSRVRVFGSRLDDMARGGDIDLMLELPEPVGNPALMAAQRSARVSRAMRGRKVDVLISAPNLMRLPIHDIAFKEGQLL